MPRRKQRTMMRLMPVTAALCVLSMAAVSACTEKKQASEPPITDPALTPTMVTRDVVTLVSDSGYTRYKITSDLWEMFEEAENPIWRFPEGLYIEKYTDDMAVEATIICDSAIYYSRQRIWELDGDVNIKNTLGDKFLTQQLFWSQDEHKVYSDSFIHIERSNRIIEGYGFTSNEQMTEYDILKPSGIFPVPERKQQEGSENAEPAVAEEESVQPEPQQKAPETKNKPAAVDSGRVSFKKQQ